MLTTLTNCHVIDGVSEDPVWDAAVYLEDSVIVDVTSANSVGRRAAEKVIDCRGGWLVPGLWDVHVHLQFPDITPSPDIGERVIKYGVNAMEGLRDAGVTSIRTAGVDNWIDVAWKKTFASSVLRGPTIFAGGHFLTTTAGHCHGQQFAIQCDGPDAFLKAIRNEIQHGVDHIKLDLSGGIMGPPWDQLEDNFLLTEELDAAFRLCRLRNYKVMVHATNPTAVKLALNSGAWSVEHGYVLDDECIDRFLKTDAALIPTLGVSHLTPRQSSGEWEERFMKGWTKVIPEAFFERADERAPDHRKWFQKALQSGVKMAIGSDLGPVKEGALLEMGLWVKNGASTMRAIQAATSVAAKVCGADKTSGSIEIGKTADILVVRENPLCDINNLRKIQMVIKGGVPVAY